MNPTNTPTDPNTNPIPSQPEPLQPSVVVASTPVPPVQPVAPTPVVAPAPVAPEPAAPSYFGGVSATDPVSPQPVNPTAPIAGVTPIDTMSTPSGTSSKSFKKLIIILAVVVVVIAALVISYFVIKGKDDKVADTYTSSLTSYFHQLDDAAASSAGTPIDTQTAIKAVKKPVLASVFLGSISQKYTKAVTLSKNADKELTSFNAQLAQFVSLYNYETAYSSINDKLSDALDTVDTDPSATLNSILSLLNQLKAKVSATNPPSALSSDFTTLSGGYTAIITDWSAAVAAFNNRDETAYNTALNNYTNDYTNKVQSANDAINNYYNDLSDKFSGVADGLTVYANSIKDN